MDITKGYNGNKAFRLINMYERLNKGELLEKIKLAEEFCVTPKTVQRDIDDLRAYLSETHATESDIAIKYDKLKNGYYLLRFEREWLTNEEVLAVTKILLESRAFEKSEMNILVKKLLEQVVPNDKKHVEKIIKNEHFYYVPPRHNQKILTSIWEISKYINQNEIISFAYTRKDKVNKEHFVKPVAIMFSEYYFYLIGFMADDTKEYPTVFRIDRMKNIKGTKENFKVPYHNKFNDGEFRKRVQFMYSGELRRITFEYSGPSIESVLDRLPTAEIIKEKDGIYTVKVEVYGDGINMWLKSQGDYVKVID